jgi:hypothetical protein
MDEATFVDSIDARFPYTDLDAGLQLAEHACTISANAAFAVVDELARPPRGTAAPSAHRLAILERIRELLDHPLASVVLDLARRLVRDERPSVDDALRTMRLISAHPGQYAALSVAYFACEDSSGHADREYQRILKTWDAA